MIELMIVISIIGILAAVAVPQFNAYRLRGYNIGGKSDAKNASIAQEAYYVDNKTYTSDFNNLKTYGYRQMQSVEVRVSGGNNDYTIVSYHGNGDKTYTLFGPGGNINSN